MIRNQRPGETRRLRFIDDIGKPFEKIIPVRIIKKNLPTLDAPHNNIWIYNDFETDVPAGDGA